jgi:LPXTG-site transpeptidase (sortase) family protein
MSLEITKKIKFTFIGICIFLTLSIPFFAIFPSLLYPYIMNYIYRMIQQNVVLEQWDKESELLQTDEVPDINLILKDMDNPDKLKASDLFPLKLTIPSIECEWIVNEGDGKEVLKKGPGHVVGTFLPGQNGRCAIAGHRTTYGAPFWRLSELNSGDIIELQLQNGLRFYFQVKYKVSIKNDDPFILRSYNKRELVLFGCNPRYTYLRRLAVISELVKIGFGDSFVINIE